MVMLMKKAFPLSCSALLLSNLHTAVCDPVPDQVIMAAVGEGIPEQMWFVNVSQDSIHSYEHGARWILSLTLKGSR